MAHKPGSTDFGVLGGTAIFAPVAMDTVTVDDTDVLVPIAPTSNPLTADVVADAGPLTLPLSIQALNIPPAVLIIGGVLSAGLIIMAVVRARARKRTAQAKGVAGFIRRIRGK